MHRVEISISGYQVRASSGEWPEMEASFRSNAELAEDFELESKGEPWSRRGTAPCPTIASR
jgi:hypothetical protein